MYLSKRSNGRYYIYFPQSNGKMTCISTKTKIKIEATIFLSNFSKELKRRDLQKVTPITLSQFRLQFLRYSESIHSKKHTETLKATLSVLIKHFGDIQLSQLTQQNLQKFAEDRLKVVSVYSVKRDKADLSSAFRYAIDYGFVKENKAKLIKLPKLPEIIPSFFSLKEFETLLKELPDKDFKDLVCFAVYSGLRQMELITLEWSQIDFKNGLMILDNSKHITKSKKVRSIPLSIKALQILTEREIHKNSNLVFTFNNLPIKPSYLTHKFKYFLLKADLNPRLKFHSLRHTFASWLVQKGVSIYQVSKLLGHANVETTEIYSHLRAEDLRSAINVLNN